MFHFSRTQQKIVQDLVKTKDCGPILIRLSWHDAGVFSDGDLKGGCPNAVMRFTDAGDFAERNEGGLKWWVLLPFYFSDLVEGDFQKTAFFLANLKMHFHMFQMSNVGDFRILDVGGIFMTGDPNWWRLLRLGVPGTNHHLF